MSEQELTADVLHDALAQAEVIRLLARDEDNFTAAFQDFRTADAEAFQGALERAGLLERLHLVCGWMRIKESVLLCHELLGPPKFDKVPDQRDFTQRVARALGDEAEVADLASIVEKRDRDAFGVFLSRHELLEFGPFFCQWLATVRCRLICSWIGRTDQVPAPRLDAQLMLAGHALGALLEDGFDDAAAAWTSGNDEKLEAVLDKVGIVFSCRLVCEWFCSWRCVLVCLTFCREFPVVEIPDPVREAFEFARITDRLRRDPRTIGLILGALENDEPKAFSEVISRLGWQKYCIQICHWLCTLRCRRFCFFLCPPPDTIPLFTNVGQYRVQPAYGHFQPDGTTTAEGWAFTSTIPLIGILPDGQATTAIEYRFQVAEYPALVPVDVVGTMMAQTQIGHLEFRYWDAGTSSWQTDAVPYLANHSGATVSIPQQFGPPLSVAVNATVKAGGWIEVPRENDLSNGGRGRFVRNSDRLAELDTTQFTDELFDLTLPAPGLVAGDAVPSGSYSEKPRYRISFQARKVVGGAGVNANDLTSIAFSNTRYRYARHPEWAGATVVTRSVSSLDIFEIRPPAATGCDRLLDQLTAMYSAYHPYLHAVRLWFEGNSPLPADTVPAISAGEAHSTAPGEVVDISALAPCAYILWLDVTVGLTAGTGLIGDATNQDHIAFCKSKPGRPLNTL